MNESEIPVLLQQFRPGDHGDDRHQNGDADHFQNGAGSHHQNQQNHDLFVTG